MTSCSYCSGNVENDEVEQCPCCGEGCLCPECLAEHDCTGRWDEEDEEDAL